MLKLTVRDLLGTLLVGAIVLPFVGYSIWGSVPFVQDPMGMAGVGIAGCLLAFAAFGRKAFGTGAFETTMAMTLILAVGCGIVAFLAASWAMLVPMVAGVVIMWALALLHDAGWIAPDQAAQRTGGP